MTGIRLIDANALDRNFYDSCTGECDCCSLHNIIEYGVYGCGLIHLAPTIDAAEIVHGRWVYDDLGHTYCSKCHERLPYIHCYSEEPCSDYDEAWDEEIPETRYCPNCGAKMDG